MVVPPRVLEDNEYQLSQTTNTPPLRTLELERQVEANFKRIFPNKFIGFREHIDAKYERLKNKIMIKADLDMQEDFVEIGQWVFEAEKEIQNGLLSGYYYREYWRNQ